MGLFITKKIKNLFPNIKVKKSKKGKKLNRFVLILLILVFILILPPLTFNLYFLDKVYPQTYVGNLNLGGKTRAEAERMLTDIAVPKEISLKAEDSELSLPLDSINFKYLPYDSFSKAYEKGNFVSYISSPYLYLLNLLPKKSIPLSYLYDQEKLDQLIFLINTQVSIEPIAPSFSVENSTVNISQGSSGKVLDKNDFKSSLLHAFNNADFSKISLPIKNVSVVLTQEDEKNALQRANILLLKKLVITFEDRSFIYAGEDLIGLLNPLGGYEQTKVEALSQKIAAEVDRPAKNPTFTFQEGSSGYGKVTEFAPSQDGIKTKTQDLGQLIEKHLDSLLQDKVESLSFAVPVTTTPSEYKTEDVNQLGIKELIGKGTSRFVGSIPGRVYNIALAASKINGTIVKPGETFSFNSVVGDATKENGFQEAYIIKDGQTVLGDGGGVCQVSTTLFRAILNGGFPITERRAHSYRVGYYEQDSPPGIDATVYYPTTDLKFINDSPAHILIQTKVDTKAKTLEFDIYGTSDGRVATISKPIVSEQVAPPEDLYTDDPTLPTGVIKQVDYKAWGAKVTFNYKVVRGADTLISKTYVSKYQPWQARFLRGTGPAQ